MANVIAEAAVRIRPDTGAFRSETEAGVLGAVKKIAVAAGGIFAAQKVFDFGKQAVEEAALTQKATENIKAQFGDAAEGVLRFSDNAAHAFGISKSASEAFSSTIGLTAKNLGLSHGAAALMDVQLQKLAGSVGLIKGEDPAGFFDKLKLAVLGNTRGLKQMGISVDTTSESQFALNHNIVQAVVDHTAVTKATLAYHAAQKSTAEVLKQSGRGSVEYRVALNKEKQAQDALDKAREGSIPKLTAAQKAQAIVGLATQHLSQLQDEARKHSGDFADEMIKLRAELDNVKEEIGAALLPALAAIAKVLLEDVVPAVGAVADAFKAFVQTIPPDVLKGIALGIGLVTAAWLAYTVAQYAAATALAVFNAAFDISGPGLIVIAIVAVVAALYVLYERVGIVHDAVQAAFGFIKEYVPAALDAVRSVVEAFIAESEHLWAEYGGKITEAVKTAFGFVKTIITNDVRIVEDVIKIALAVIHGNWSDAWNSLKDLVRTALNQVTSTVTSVLRNLVPLAARAASAVGSAIKSGITGAISGIGSALASGVRSAINALISAADAGLNVIVDHWPDIPGAPGPPFGHNPIPHVARGAIVNPTTLGSMLIAGEAGQREAVIPLPAKLEAAFTKIADGKIGGGGVTINGPLIFQTNATSFAALEREALNRRALQVRR